MHALGFLALLLVAYCCVVSLHILHLTVCAYLFKKRTQALAAPPPLAVLIPAHNEAVQIASVIAKVRESDYPADRFSVFVIADNCDDGTAAICRKAGARVWERSEPARPGKGQALNWFLRSQPEAYADLAAIVIIDADTLIDPAFLKEVAGSFCCPEVVVVQGYNGVLNDSASWRTALATAAFNVFNHLRCAGHERIGGTAGLRGNGMAFRTEILSRYGWPSESVVEDADFSLKLLLDDILVHYNPDAKVHSVLPERGKQAEAQRMRWEGANFQLFRRYFPPLVKAFVTTGRFRFLDTALDLLTPPLALFLVCLAVTALLSLPFPGLFWPLPFCLLAVIFYVVSGQLQTRAPLRIWLSLAAAPCYLLWKIPVYLKMIATGNRGWVRTERAGEMGGEGGKR